MREAPEPIDDAVDVRLKPVILRAIDEATRRGAANVEAEHLLLVISAGDDASARALAEFGLDHAAVEAALDAERVRALEVAGVAPIGEERLRSTRRVRPGWGASFRDAMRRADFRARRDRGRDERERLAVVGRAARRAQGGSRHGAAGARLRGRRPTGAHRPSRTALTDRRSSAVCERR